MQIQIQIYGVNVNEILISICTGLLFDIILGIMINKLWICYINETKSSILICFILIKLIKIK